MQPEKNVATPPAFALPQVGTALTLLSGLSFLVVSMLLPMVGKAAVKVVHYRQNVLTFSAVLLLSTILAVLAVVSKMQRRRIDGSPLPYFSLLMLALCVGLGAALVAGLLKI
jgi:hypothetical protein